jgi:hypothetical protein
MVKHIRGVKPVLGSHFVFFTESQSAVPIQISRKDKKPAQIRFHKKATPYHKIE